MMFRNLIYGRNENPYVQPALIKLLILTCPKEMENDILNKIKSDTINLNEFIAITQKIWISNINNRWDNNGVLANEDEIKSILNEIGIWDGLDLSATRYDVGVMLGGSVANMAKRFFELQDAMKSGKYFKEIVCLGSHEDVSKYAIVRLPQIMKAYPERFKKNVEIPNFITEHEVMHFFINNLNFPLHFSQATITSLPLPMKQANDGKLIKPNTQDELTELKHKIVEKLKTEEKQLRLAIFSNAPFSNRQHLISVGVLFDVLKDGVETFAASYHDSSHKELNSLEGVNVNTKQALDELARLLYQLRKFIVEVKTAIKILKLDESPEQKIKNRITY